MRKWLPLITVCLGTFMLLIDVTIVNVALPDMAGDLKTSFTSLQWVVDAYALALAALVLGSGSIADRIGHRRAYVGGLALFAAASFVCGIAPNAGALITARTVQGVGAAAMFATTFALLNSNYQGRDRGTAYGMWGAVSGASAAVGPIIGGLLTEGLSWRWIFFVNLPVSVLAITLCLTVLGDTQDAVKTRVDLVGMATFTAAAGSLTYGLIKANEGGWATPASWGWFVAAAVLSVTFVLVERARTQPMLDLELMRNRTFVGVLLAGLVLTLSAFSAFTYTSIWLQSVLGLSPIEAGLTGLPLSLSAFLVSAAIGRFLHGSRSGPIIGGGMVLIGLGGIVGAVFVHGSASWPALVPGFVLIGVGVGLATPTLGSTAMAAVAVQRGGMAAGAVNTARQLGFALGIAALGSVFATRSATVLRDQGVPQAGRAAKAVAGGQAKYLLQAVPARFHDRLDAALHAASVSGLQWAFAVAGVAGLVFGVLCWALMRPSGQPATRQAPQPQQTRNAEPARD
jgi:EmrB/QacA subfamily drug resistance transporter